MSKHYKVYRDYNGDYDIYEEEPRSGGSTVGCLFVLLNAVTWWPFFLLQLPIWIISIIRGISRIRSKEKVRSGIYLLTVGIIAGIMCIIFYAALFTGNWNKLQEFLSQ